MTHVPPPRPPRWLRLGKVVLALMAAVLVLRWLLFHGPVREVEMAPESGIVDLHCHVAGIGAGLSGCFVADRLRRSWRLEHYLAAFGVSLEDLEDQGDALVVERLAERVRQSERVSQVVVLALDGVVGEDGVLDRERTEVYVPNEFVRRSIAGHPELLFGASVHPRRRDALELLEQVKAQGAVLVKWLPSIQEIDPADPLHELYYRKLVELDLPLLTHTGRERSFTHARDELADPWRLELPLSLGVRVIAAHAASGEVYQGQDGTERLAEMLARFPGLMSDISALTQINKLGVLDRVLEDERFAGRLLYGSDFPLIETALVSPWYLPLHLSIRSMWDLARIDNPWDRDVALKQALGVPRSVFEAGAAFLRADGD